MFLATMLHWGEIAAGLALLLIVLYDIFQSVVLPRPAINKLATVRYLVRGIYWVWRWVGNRMESIPRRERWLAAYGPVAVLTIFTAWGLALVLAYGLIVDGVRDEMRPVPDNFGTSLYFSATTLVPLSYGDFVPEGVPARLATVAESATGVILGALAITLLFSLYESFQRREELVVTLDAFAGAPPSGVQMLETASSHGMPEELVKTFDDWRQWAAAVLESHLAYPMLVFFRSSHDNEAWERWRKAGYHCNPADAAWTTFARLRSSYASPINGLARALVIPPAEWIGDRSYLPHRQRETRRRPFRRRRD